MKKITTILLGVATAFMLSLSVTSCEDYLDKAPASDIGEADVFGNFTSFQGFIEQMYNCIVNYDKAGAWNRFNFADENLTNSPDAFDLGNWWANETYFFGQAANPFNITCRSKRVWEYAWYAIRQANIALEHLDGEDDEFIGTDEERNLLKGQALFFRGFFYYEICRYWGGMPYVDHVIGASEDMTTEEYNRLPAQESFKLMAKDFGEAAKLLPAHWDETVAGQATSGNNDQRVNRYFALGFQGKALLWAASPMVNEEATGKNEFDGELCKQAADALGELLKLSDEKRHYYLEPWANYDQIFWMPNYARTGAHEVIMNSQYYDRRVRWSALAGSIPAALEMNGTASEGPTQNIIKNFGMANGLPIDDPESGFDPNDPWTNRDPRFDLMVVIDGDRISSLEPANRNYYAELFNNDVTNGHKGYHRNGGDYGKGSDTGYYYRKYTGMGKDFNANFANKLEAHCPYLRMADVYLMYAEAVNWMTGGGPSAKASTYTKTAVEAFEAVRARCGIPALPSRYTSDKATFFEQIVRERAVELLMEAQRFDDLRRWNRIADPRYLDKTCIDFDRGADGKPINISERVIIRRVASSPKMNWLPIQVKYTKMYKGFSQNPGW